MANKDCYKGRERKGSVFTKS